MFGRSGRRRCSRPVCLRRRHAGRNNLSGPPIADFDPADRTWVRSADQDVLRSLAVEGELEEATAPAHGPMDEAYAVVTLLMERRHNPAGRLSDEE